MMRVLLPLAGSHAAATPKQWGTSVQLRSEQDESFLDDVAAAHGFSYEEIKWTGTTGTLYDGAAWTLRTRAEGPKVPDSVVAAADATVVCRR